MKKLMLIVASALFIGGVSSYAQDTTGNYRARQGMDKTKSMNQDDHTIKNDQDVTKDQGTSRDNNGVNNSSDQSGMKGWTKVNSADVPASLRQTLSGSQYTGWERSTVYVSPSGDRYSVRIGDQNPKTYFFDKNGKEINAGSSTLTK